MASSNIIFKSRKEFIKLYRNFEEFDAKETYLEILTELKRSIRDGNFDNFSKLAGHLEYIASIKPFETLQEYYDCANNPFGKTNLIILACKYAKCNILKYLLNENGKNMINLSISMGSRIPNPDDRDEECHSAFYYAIRSGNTELIDLLIRKWSDNSMELGKILSETYEELNLKNVPVSDKMRVLLEYRLVSLRFFSNDSKQPNRSVKISLDDIEDRIRMVLENIRRLNVEFQKSENVSGRFLHVVKFIAKNIHILKQQLKSTYNRLPWEEMEFCLICFIFANTKIDEMSFLYYSALNKSNILDYLENFGVELEQVMEELENNKDADSFRFLELPKLSRDKARAQIIQNHPQFKHLYNDYQRIRDIYSLKKINDSLELASSVDPKERGGPLVIIRALQVIAENIKNTLESPKLSQFFNEFLLLTLPKNIREIIIDLCSSLSNGYSLSKRTEIEANTEANFFVGIQNDMEMIFSVVGDILDDSKIQTIESLLERILSSEDINEVHEVTKVFTNFQLEKLNLKNKILLQFQEKLNALVGALSDIIPEKTSYEIEIFRKIDKISDSVQMNSKYQNVDFAKVLDMLNDIASYTSDGQIDANILRGLKVLVKDALDILKTTTNPTTFKQVIELATKAFVSAQPRLKNDQEARLMLMRIYYLAECQTDNNKWMENLRDRLQETIPFPLPAYNGVARTCRMQPAELESQLALKLTELKDMLRSSQLQEFMNNFESFETNKTLQASVEMLVLDIMSILDVLGNLDNNHLFLDDTIPLLTGKALHNHLAHHNALIDVLLPDPAISVIVSAKKLLKDEIHSDKRKIEPSSSQNDWKSLKWNFERGLAMIANQERMFTALEEGNFEVFRSCIENGADIYSKSPNFWTSLHSAVKGGNLDAVKFIIDQKLEANVKTVNKQSALHIAAANGRTEIVEFLIKRIGLEINDKNSSGKTPLHNAAKGGHETTVEILLKNKADPFAKDDRNFIPLHWAIESNRKTVVETIFKNVKSIKINQSCDNLTFLRLAAEMGHTDLVNFLLSRGSNVNGRIDSGDTALHSAASVGYFEIVATLISRGADVNAKECHGCTPLHYAIEGGHMTVTQLLLENGANVNVKCFLGTSLHQLAMLMGFVKRRVKTIGEYTPLHFAVQIGNLEIVSALLKYGANVNAKYDNNTVALHSAAEHGYREVVELLICHKAKIDAVEMNNRTALHFAAYNGHGQICELLAQYGANTNVRDVEHVRPIHVAAMNGHLDCVEILLRHRAEINARNKVGHTALHLAAQEGHREIVTLLVVCGANVNSKSSDGSTALDFAISGGDKEMVEFLLANRVRVEARKNTNRTPLHAAVETGIIEIVEILIAHGSDVNAKTKINQTPLLCAVKNNRKEIVELLIRNGADVNANGGDALKKAVFAGYSQIVDVFLRNNANIARKNGMEFLLQVAVIQGHKDVVKSLLERGVNINAVFEKGCTALHLAVLHSHKEIAKMLLANGADINPNCEVGTPLHLALCNKESEEIIRILLDNGADLYVRDAKNRSPPGFAVACNHLTGLKEILSRNKTAINIKYMDSLTLLHIAAQSGNLEIAKYLVEQGADLHAKNSSDDKPMHIAARNGQKNLVEFFLSQGMEIDNRGRHGQTLLHYAIMDEDRVELVEYLIEQGADLNVSSVHGCTPTILAASMGHKQCLRALLDNGAEYNTTDVLNNTALDNTTDDEITVILEAIADLFKAVSNNKPRMVEDSIKKGAIVNAKNTKGFAPLHLAASKGYAKIASILLEKKADPDSLAKGRCTPLHYAAKLSHIGVVKILLAHGAVYNAETETHQTPLDYAVNQDTCRILRIVDEAFQDVQSCNLKVINNIKKIKDMETVKAIMNARDKQKRALVHAAEQSQFPKVDQLKEILQEDVSLNMAIVDLLNSNERYQESLEILDSVLQKRIRVLGPNNPATFEIQLEMAKVLYKQQNFKKALKLAEELLEKQRVLLGMDHKDTLKSRGVIALIFFRQEKLEESLKIFKDICAKQIEILPENHPDIFETQIHMAAVLEGSCRLDEALDIYTNFFEKNKRITSKTDPATLVIRNNMAKLLTQRGDYEKAQKIFREVYEIRNKTLGPNHSQTLRTLFNDISTLAPQGKYDEAIDAYQDLLERQKRALGPNHPDIFNTQLAMSDIYSKLGENVKALRMFKESFERRKGFLGPDHPEIKRKQAAVDQLDALLKLQCQVGQNDIAGEMAKKNLSDAINAGDIKTVQLFLNSGKDINEANLEGRSPLHFAASSGQCDIARMLLRNGADPLQTTNKGNTALHLAVAKGFVEVIKLLFEHISREKLSDFINAKTIGGGTTALHTAAKNGSIEIVKLLLKHGAVYDIRDNDDKIPINLSNSLAVKNLLRTVSEFFEDVISGNVDIIRKLGMLKAKNIDEFLAITNTRNCQEATLLQTAIFIQNREITFKLLEILKS